MSEISPAIHVEIYVSLSEDASTDEVDDVTRKLLKELREIDIDSAELALGETKPTGSKAADPVTVGVILVAVLPSLLLKLVEFAQAWALRGQGRTVKFKGQVAGQEIEFQGTAQELHILLDKLSALP